MVDDDMKMDALPDTGVLKALVTLADKFDVERKGRQSEQRYLYVRIIAFSNGSLSALYDKSDGFYRRQLILQVRDKPEGRADDRDLGQKLVGEKEGILLWCLEGLRDLAANGYEFAVSDRMRRNLEEIRKEDNNIIEFLESDGYIRFEQGTMASSKQLYGAYRKWCEDNLEKPFSERTFTGQLKTMERRLGIEYVKSMDVGYGKRVRGYKGVHVQVDAEGNWSR